MNELRVTSGGRSYVFPPGRAVRIGRAAENDIVVNDPTVSRRHAELTWGPSGWQFGNLGQARAFEQGQEITQIAVRAPVSLALASPNGPVLILEPQRPALSRPGPGYGPPGHHAPGVGDELVTAFEILVPVKTWLRNPGWHQGLRLLVIAYALLPLLFLALLSNSTSLAVPGFAYSLYVAPLWAIAFWLLVRPGPVGRLESLTGIAIIVWVTVWLNAVTVNINDHMVNAVRNGNFLASLAVGYNEEITKALPVLLAALILLKFRGLKLDARMWMFLGTISGLTFGVLEERLYTELAISQVAGANAVSQADAGVLDFAFRVFVDGFEHAVWAGVSAFFIGIAINYPRRRWQLILLGVSMVAVLHGLNDWSVSTFNSYWPGILIQAVSLLLFLGYTMSASSIEGQVRQTPLFRGESMIMEALPRTGAPTGDRTGDLGRSEPAQPGGGAVPGQ
jgi:RsiW-degrading membrane proteinase PrsW (M82 family)